MILLLIKMFPGKLRCRIEILSTGKVHQSISCLNDMKICRLSKLLRQKGLLHEGEKIVRKKNIGRIRDRGQLAELAAKLQRKYMARLRLDKGYINL